MVETRGSGGSRSGGVLVALAGLAVLAVLGALTAGVWWLLRTDSEPGPEAAASPEEPAPVAVPAELLAEITEGSRVLDEVISLVPDTDPPSETRYLVLEPSADPAGEPLAAERTRLLGLGWQDFGTIREEGGVRRFILRNQEHRVHADGQLLGDFLADRRAGDRERNEPEELARLQEDFGDRDGGLLIFTVYVSFAPTPSG